MKQMFVGAVAILSVAFLLNADAQEKPKYSVKEVMQKAMKSGLCKKVASGKGSDAEKQELVELFTSLHQNKPKKGDSDNWKKMTDALLAAAKSGDGKALATAANCAACHKEHK
jgi:hypothetical protein